MGTHTADPLLQAHGMASGPARATGLIASSLNAIGRAAREFVRRWRERRDILELQRMDDRLLADIGITRGEVEHMVQNGRWVQASFEADAAFPATDRKRSSVLNWDKELGERA